jgi:polyphosphate kinase
MGSSDWMNRNIYRRIEVCFPIKDEALKADMLEIVELQLEDNVSAVAITESDMNLPINGNGEAVRSQERIYEMVHSGA